MIALGSTSSSTHTTKLIGTMKKMMLERTQTRWETVLYGNENVDAPGICGMNTMIAQGHT